MTIDFKSLKKSSTNSLSKLNDELTKLASPTNKPQDDNRFWRPEVDKAGNGYAVIRFLPAPSGEDVPFVNSTGSLKHSEFYRVYFDGRVIDFGEGETLYNGSEKLIINPLIVVGNILLTSKEKGLYQLYVDYRKSIEQPFKGISDLEKEGRVKCIEDPVISAMKRDGWFTSSLAAPENVESFEFSALVQNAIPANALRPSHYGGEDNQYEVFKVLKAWGLDKCFYLGNVIKYVARAGKKDPSKEIEDLEKAVVYLQHKIQILKK